MAQVLLVDDDEGMRTALEYFLAGEGHQVVTACDGVDALDKLADDVLPDVAVLDYYMPVMDGLQLAKAMRADDRLASIPVIMISAASQIPHLPGVLVLPKVGLREDLPAAIARMQVFKGKLE